MSYSTSLPLLLSYLSLPAPPAHTFTTPHPRNWPTLLQTIAALTQSTPHDEFENPNTTAEILTTQLTQIGIQVPEKTEIIKAYGQPVVKMVTQLAEMMVLKQGLQAPVYKDIITPDDDMMNDDEPDAELIDDTPAEAYANSDDEEEDDDANLQVPTERPKTAMEKKTKNTEATEIDPIERAQEIERVAPLLKIQIGNEGINWKYHIDSYVDLAKKLDSLKDSLMTPLETQTQHITNHLSQIDSRESYINTTFAQQSGEYANLLQILGRSKSKNVEAKTKVEAAAQEMSQLGEEIETIKSQMEVLGTDMTNPKPLVNLRATLKQLKQEMKSMDVRLGVVQNQVTAALLRESGGGNDAEWQNNYRDEPGMTVDANGDRDGCNVS